MVSFPDVDKVGRGAGLLHQRRGFQTVQIRPGKEDGGGGQEKMGKVGGMLHEVKGPPSCRHLFFCEAGGKVIAECEAGTTGLWCEEVEKIWASPCEELLRKTLLGNVEWGQPALRPHGGWRLLMVELCPLKRHVEILTLLPLYEISKFWVCPKHQSCHPHHLC